MSDGASCVCRSKSKLLHILTFVAGIASSCPLIQLHRLSGQDWLALFCVGTLRAEGCPAVIIYFWELALLWELIGPNVRAALSTSCSGSHGHPACWTLQTEWLSLLPLIPLPLPCSVYFCDKLLKNDVQCIWQDEAMWCCPMLKASWPSLFQARRIRLKEAV